MAQGHLKIKKTLSGAVSTFVIVVMAIGCVGLVRTSCFAQLTPYSTDSQIELSDAVGLKKADNRVAAEIERAKAFAADRQWNEAVATLRQVMEQSGDQLWPIAPRRFVAVRDYGNLLLTRWPTPARAVYRAQVDPLAQRWYEEAMARHDPALLRKIVHEAFASSYADDALLALGEMALDRGDAARARAWWERILPIDPAPTATNGWLAVPDTDINVAAVRARLILASILEGSQRRATEELTQFERLHPKARGRLAGREVDLAAALRELLAESAAWPANHDDRNWPTFAGAPTRTRINGVSVDPAGVAWRLPLAAPKEKAADNDTTAFGIRIADVWSPAGPAFHPVRVGPLVLANDAHRIWALRSSTGEPAWGSSAVVFDGGRNGTIASMAELRQTFGRPQYTMTVYNGKLYARMGNPRTGLPRHVDSAPEPSYLVAIDLAGEGRLLWKALPDSGPWMFEGSPLCDGTNVYVAMRRGDIRAQAHIACFDAQTGDLRWRRFICAAETPGQNIYPEMTHNLVTLGDGMLFYNTNMGAVAAISTDGGHIQWVSLYPRLRRLDLAKLDAHWGRSLNPCVYHKGILYVAPADSRRIFALDAFHGQILWQTGSQVEDVVHLLGISGEQLIATGKRVYWIGANGENQGRIQAVWPKGESLPIVGRGVIARQSILVPTADRIYVLDRQTAELVKTIDLQSKNVPGGNLLIVNNRLLISTENELIALGSTTTRQQTSKSQNPKWTMTQKISNLKFEISNLRSLIPNP